tara:strand:- start:686 stop:808 length:123 start_codon:yes stop_codon:yes gene_type:complete
MIGQYSHTNNGHRRTGISRQEKSGHIGRPTVLIGMQTGDH